MAKWWDNDLLIRLSRQLAALERILDGDQPTEEDLRQLREVYRSIQITIYAIELKAEKQRQDSPRK